MRCRTWLAVLLAWAVFPPLAAPGQTPDILGSDPPLTLGDLAGRAEQVVFLRAEEADQNKRTLTFGKVADLKGRYDRARLEITDGLSTEEPEKTKPAAPGPRESAVCFITDDQASLYLGDSWWECVRGQDGSWRVRAQLRDHHKTYAGPADKLREHLTAILAGKEVVVPVRLCDPYRVPEDSWRLRGSQEDPRAQRCPARVRARLTIAGTLTDLIVPAEAYPAFVDWGWDDKEMSPYLIAALQHPAREVRAQAAADLREVMPPPRSSLPALRKALADPEGAVRVHAAHTLVRIEPKDQAGMDTLLAGLYKLFWVLIATYCNTMTYGNELYDLPRLGLN